MSLSLPSQLALLLLVIFLAVSLGPGDSSLVEARSAYDDLANNGELSKFKEWIDKDDLLVLFLKKRGVTIFVPNNIAMQTYQDKNPNLSSEQIRKLVSYHVLIKSINRKSFPFSTETLEGKWAPIYLSVQDFGPNDQTISRGTHNKFYYANNAYILEAREDLRSMEGQEQSLYIIDEVLTAYDLRSSGSVSPSALSLIENPNLYGLEYDLSNFLEHIRRNKLESVFSQAGEHTFFVPSKQPLAGAPEFDAYVVKAHVVFNEAHFIRTMGDKKKFKTLANDNNIEVELSLINMTSRFSADKMFFIQTNTVKNDANHKAGKIMSRLNLANIPVSNGVVHIIERPLMLMDMSVRDFLRTQSKLSRFYKMLEAHPDIMSEINRRPLKTILAPDDNAFDNLILNNNFSEVEKNNDRVESLLRQHVIFESISSSDLKKKNNFYQTKASDDSTSIQLRLIGTDPNVRLTVESGNVNATAIQSDFGASDGILHIIDRVLGIPFKTMREKLRAHKELKETFKIGTQGGASAWNTKLADENKRYTFFAPSDQAWVNFAKEYPSEFKQLDQERYPFISRAILDRHLSAKGQFNNQELLQRVKKLETIQGELQIVPDPITKEIYIEWNGIKAKVTEVNILGLNGVIHVIDRVLAIRRDFTVSSSPLGASCSVPLMLAMFLANLMRH